MNVILVIDDEESIRNLLKTFLAKLGYRVHLAKNGWEGIRLLNSGNKYCAVLTDIGMPEVNGYDIVRHVKKSTGPRIPVLAITGLQENSFKSRLFDSVIQKPFNLIKLERTLQSIQNVEGSNGPVAPDIRKS